MNYSIIQPPLHLAEFIRQLWFLEYSATTDIPFVHDAFAHHCCEIVFCYKGEFSIQVAGDRKNKLISGFYGQTKEISKITSATSFGVLGLYLYPYALPQLFGIPANELTNHSIDLKTLCGQEGEILEERIMLASGNKQRAQILFNFFEARLRNIRTELSVLCSSLKAISNHYTPMSVETLASNNFLSVRQFERRLKELSGFSPKQFLRLTRFNSLLNRPWQDQVFAEIALDFGYYDESHFSHDFKKFSGINPKDFFNPYTIKASDRGTAKLSQSDEKSSFQ